MLNILNNNKTESLPEMHLWNQDETKQITITVESTDDGDWVIGELRNGTSTITLFKTKF